MSAITAEEVRPGLSVFLDNHVLLGCADCRSNARTRANLVNRPGPFLVLAEAAGGWLCVPLVSHAGASRLALDQALKSGPGNGWTHRPSYYSIHQFWIIPTERLVEASGGEFSPHGDRQRYAAKRPDALEAIARRQFDSDAPYRSLPDLR